jgi:hypothetical protein
LSLCLSKVATGLCLFYWPSRLNLIERENSELCCKPHKGLTDCTDEP